MDYQHSEDGGDPQQQFLEAFKELLDLQNQRMTSMNDMINQYCPQLLYPLIMPTQVPNTFVVNLGPYYANVQTPHLYNQQVHQQSVSPMQQVKEEDDQKK